MSAGQSLFIPRTDLGDAWVAAIRAAQDALPPTNGTQFTEIYRDLTPFEEDANEDKIILYTGTEDIIASVESSPETDTFSPEVIASRILSRLSQLAASGARSIIAGTGSLEIPNIGLVSISPRLATNTEGRQHKSTALAMYQTLDVREGGDATWASESFFFSSGQLLTGGQRVIDLTGRARFLMHGPYVELPAGFWSGEIFFNFDPTNLSPSLLRFEWGDGRTFAHEDVELAEAGSYSLKLSSEWEAPAPAQFRLLLLRPAFHGTLSVTRCQVTLNHR